MDQCVAELIENEPEELQETCQILVRIAENILKYPSDEKYRKLRVSNPLVAEKLLPKNGAMSCLFSMGFEEDDEFLSMPANNNDTSRVLAICNQIKSVMAKSVTAESTSNKVVTGAQQQKEGGNASTDETQKWPRWIWPQLPANITTLELNFAQKVTSAFGHVLMYEDPTLQEKARSCMPLERFEAVAKRKFEAIQGPSSFDKSDIYLTEMMDWFRDDFFRWVNAPDCEKCNSKTNMVGNASPSQDDIMWGGHRVELYKCSACTHTTRFPRYNHPGKLLDTRRGRCGEWANCFTLLCRAVGFEARHVLDWTDHVWTEVYSHSQKRWLHCDPGEKALDRPLLYEAGWGKKLTYIIACSKDDLNDVTWRYSAKHQNLIQRRTQCREQWLIKFMEKLRVDRQRGMSDVVKKVHQLRLIQEFSEFISPKKPLSAGELVGRQTGSLAWREGRGEMGSNKISAKYCFKPSDREVQEKVMIVEYSSADNTYKRLVDGSTEYGWENCVFESEAIMRNVEVDWNMTYLARNKGAPSASISWRLEVPSGAHVTTVEIRCQSETFHNANVEWSLANGDQSIILYSHSNQCLSEFGGSKYLILTAKLTGGKGDDAWQHTQLFRQKRDSKESMLKIKLVFADD